MGSARVAERRCWDVASFGVASCVGCRTIARGPNVARRACVCAAHTEVCWKNGSVRDGVCSRATYCDGAWQRLGHRFLTAVAWLRT